MLSVIMLSIAFSYCNAEYHYANCPYAECRYAGYQYAGCHYAECRHAERCDAKTSAYILLQSSKNLSVLVSFVSTCRDFGYIDIFPNTNSAKLGQMFGKKSI